MSWYIIMDNMLSITWGGSMADIVRIHFRTQDGKRSTVSLDKGLCEMILDLGYDDLAGWVQRTHDRMIEEQEKGLRGSQDKSLSRELQSEAVSEVRRALQRQRDRVKQKEEELQRKEEDSPVLKHIIYAFEGVGRKGLLADQGVSAKLEYLRKELSTSAEHYKIHGWSIEDKKLLLRLSQAIKEIRRREPPLGHTPVSAVVNRCEAETSQKQRCQGHGSQYVVSGEREYIACKRHATYMFRPFPGVEGRKKVDG